MSILIRLSLLLFPLAAAAQSSLTACPATGIKHNCWGQVTYPNGAQYTGEFSNGLFAGRGTYGYRGGPVFVGEFEAGRYKRGTLTYPNGRRLSGEWGPNDLLSGLAIEYGPDGAVQRSGRWSEGQFVQSVAIDRTRFPFNGAPLTALAHSARPFSNTEQLIRVVQSELREWLTASPQELDEVPAPSYPGPLSLKQEQWETNKEFEDRVEKARTERRRTIERIQSDYRAKVEERNRRVDQYNKTRLERAAKLAERRRELILDGLKMLSPAVKLTDVAVDQQSGSLTVSAQLENQPKQTFIFHEVPQTFRRTALTETSKLQASPQFQVSDSGEISVEGLLISAGSDAVRGSPSSSIPKPIQLASVTLPSISNSALSPQSVATVDRNQVEQILYREENEMLRKRLEDQRRQQEQAVAAAEARATQEAVRLRAEAESLRKQLATGSAPTLAATVGLDAHALVIGNAGYPGSGRLVNPVRDAKAMAAKLRALGFKVTEVTDASRDQMVKVLSDFTRSAALADLSLLFYAGHGVQISGVNYMIPVDMNLNDPAQAALQSVSLNSVVEQYLPGKTKLVFLDACRDNPLLASAGRSVSRGLAAINASEGTLIAYATKDGQTAEDGAGSNSPFTLALLEHLDEPQDIAVVLRKVREKVVARTNGRQQPWEYGSLTGGALVLSAIKPRQ